MLLCWHCNMTVGVMDDGWICCECGQHGPPFKEPVATDWAEACKANTPYRVDES